MAYSYSVLLVLIDKEYPDLPPQDREQLVSIVQNAIEKPEAFLHTITYSDTRLSRSASTTSLSQSQSHSRSRRGHHRRSRSQETHHQLLEKAKILIRKYGILKYDPTQHIKIYNILCNIPDHIAKFYLKKVFYPHKKQLSLSTIKHILSHYLLQIYHLEGIDHALIFDIANRGWPKAKEEINIKSPVYIESLTQLYYGNEHLPKFWSKRPIRLSGNLI